MSGHLPNTTAQGAAWRVAPEWSGRIGGVFTRGDLRDTLAAEYNDVRGWECWWFWEPGPKWVVPESQGIEYGERHGEYGYVVPALPIFIGMIETVFNIDAKTTSGYRCPVGNRSIPDAHPESWHKYGSGYDFEVPGWTPGLKRAIVAWVNSIDGAYAEWYPGNFRKPHIHVELN